MRAALAILVLCVCFLLGASCSQAQGSTDNAPPTEELVIATKLAAPFAMKDEQGQWTGISIELWKKLAADLKLKYRFVEEPTVQGLIEGTSKRIYGGAIAAITVTAPREQMLDFTQPYYVTGVGIAVSAKGQSMWSQIIATLTSFGFLQAVAALLAIAVAVGSLIWFFERRHNEDFGGTPLQGLGNSMWWSAEAMTQASTGHRGPKTLPGRALAVVWMVVSIIALAVFTAAVTSSLTAKVLEGRVHGVNDLPSVRVGALTGSATVDYLRDNRIGYIGYATADEGLAALEAGRLDAFVYDKPLLAWLILQKYSTTLTLLDGVFDPQTYAIALPLNSELRKPLDIAMLEVIKSDWWKEMLFRYLGEK